MARVLIPSLLAGDNFLSPGHPHACAGAGAWESGAGGQREWHPL